MSQYIRKTETVQCENGISAQFHYGPQGIPFGRVTVVVFTRTNAQRRLWRKALERSGCKATVCHRIGLADDREVADLADADGKPIFAALTAYSVVGPFDQLERLTGSGVVKGWTDAENRIPRFGTGVGDRPKVDHTFRRQATTSGNAIDKGGYARRI